jgi:hypothetical protein
MRTLGFKKNEPKPVEPCFLICPRYLKSAIADSSCVDCREKIYLDEGLFLLTDRHPNINLSGGTLILICPACAEARQAREAASAWEKRMHQKRKGEGRETSYGYGRITEAMETGEWW